ncbi:GntR family transcriptional regulator [Mesorhizobium sp. M1A.F.Ca.IN.020.06.1.1]|uniref:GntR family transcriptional regulator n=1 Tax=unclassified Mesorhizobium TaxID=325217 RepID=UPI000BAEFEF8|nr:MULTISPECIES: GntR family transcriptional regulator [unclassified Mesorhizobium]PBB34303.1 GntR family transcriptional regulator [Mesorhizobium sp. WSM3882]RUU98178.1 GntR family transcriptional regulator [Mesorhizobium sp. M1A.F.Ca.IN.020.03.2.1]RUV84661.1 GntR family transcriptional regulator [Mesorhizobium sp. M1A.F.Ca.IN.020.32.1.1]RUW05242.1 GntR family transcriptional regulator [Mesorhizobium sp. M1A.F.Ca.IN.022.05.2.1]RUW27963.1 GntR family transcriptional regulator [Mesorhizobium sp
MISNDTSGTFEPVATRAYRVLEHMIVTLELAPSCFVTERALIERLGFGRTPVREAIQRLAWEGLLDVRPRAGIAVAPLHPGDWLRVIDARRGIEVVLARSAARFVTREAADLFHEAALAMQKAVISGNVLSFIQADKQLDEALAIAAGNPFAARVAAPLQTHSRRFWFRYKADTGLAESAEHHVALIRSILDGDEEAAAKDAKKLMALLRHHAEAAATR